MATALIKTPAIDPRYAFFKLVIRSRRFTAAESMPRSAFRARRKVIEYTGEKINRRETKRRGDGDITYLFTLDDYWTLDGAIGGSGAEIINHSCDPNLYAWNFKKHILYMSKRVIQPGEELTIDYRFDKKVERVPCLCGAKSCRGTINLLK